MEKIRHIETLFIAKTSIWLVWKIMKNFSNDHCLKSKQNSQEMDYLIGIWWAHLFYSVEKRLLPCGCVLIDPYRDLETILTWLNVFFKEPFTWKSVIDSSYVLYSSKDRSIQIDRAKISQSMDAVNNDSQTNTFTIVIIDARLRQNRNIQYHRISS